MRRPYLVDGQIVYKIPKPYSQLREVAYTYSRLLYLVFRSIDRLNAQSGQAPRQGLHSEKAINDLGLSHPPFRESVATTSRLFARIRDRVPRDVPIIVFDGLSGGHYWAALVQATKENDFHLIGGVSKAVSVAQGSGINIFAEDGAHWNNTGHRIVAEELQRYFEDHGLYK